MPQLVKGEVTNSRELPDPKDRLPDGPRMSPLNVKDIFILALLPAYDVHRLLVKADNLDFRFLRSGAPTEFGLRNRLVSGIPPDILMPELENLRKSHAGLKCEKNKIIKDTLQL